MHEKEKNAIEEKQRTNTSNSVLILDSKAEILLAIRPAVLAKRITVLGTRMLGLRTFCVSIACSKVH